MATSFFCIMQKRQDGKVYPDLHKTNLIMYLDHNEAAQDLSHDEYRQVNQVVELVAMTRQEYDELVNDKT